MKTQLLMIFFTAFLMSQLSAQFQTGDHAMSEGVQSALIVELPGADKKLSEKIWKSYAKSYGKVENNRKAKELMLVEAVIPAIDVDGQLKVFTKFDEYDQMTRALFWFKADDAFLAEMSDEGIMDGVTVFLTEYSLQVEKEVIRDELEEEEKMLNRLEKDLEKLQRKNKDLHKDIEKAREAIRRAESEIERNLLDQEAKQEEIEGQKDRISRVSDKMNNVGKN